MMYKSLVLSAALLSSTVAHSNYTQSGNTLTFDDQWWQVENPWPATGIVCSGNSGDDCTLPPGNYKWVGSSGQGHFSITGSAPASVPSPRIVYQPAHNPQIYIAGDIETFYVPCPSGTSIIGGSCLFESSYLPGVEGTIFPLESETSFSGNSLRCSLIGDSYDPENYLATLTATAACMESESTTLPVIEIN